MSERSFSPQTGTVLQYSDTGGDASPVLLVHGWTCNQTFWSAQVEHLAGRYRIITPDLAGHGRSVSDRGAWTIDGFAADVCRLVDHLRLQRVVLVGHSMGGAVALEAAARLGAGVGVVVVVDTFVFDYGHYTAKQIAELMAPFRRDLPAALHKLVQNTTAQRTDRVVIDGIAEQMARTSPTVALPAFESLFAWDPLSVFNTIAAPIRCINGALTNEKARSRYAGFVSEQVISDAGHFLMQEAPARVNEALDRALSDRA
jgi:pimeloyl-ACP methyl ester carboxylesterase